MNRDTLAADPFLYFTGYVQPPWHRYMRYNVLTQEMVQITVNDISGKIEVLNFDDVKYRLNRGDEGDTLYKIRYQTSASTSYEFCMDRLKSCLENDFLIHFGVHK